MKRVVTGSDSFTVTSARRASNTPKAPPNAGMLHSLAQRLSLDSLPGPERRRVECLLLDERFSAPGTACPGCGWLGPGGECTCPVDGRELEQLDDLTEAAIELTLQQAAEILAVRRRRGELQERAGGVAALLRF